MESFYDSDKIRLVMIGTNALEIQRMKIYQVYAIMSELSSKNETVLLRNHKICTVLFFAEVWWDFIWNITTNSVFYNQQNSLN